MENQTPSEAVTIAEEDQAPPVFIRGRVVRFNDKAFELLADERVFRRPGDRKKTAVGWVPRSVSNTAGPIVVGATITVAVPAWFARKNLVTQIPKREERPDGQ